MRLEAYGAEHGYAQRRPPEIHMGEPFRAAPEKPRTILRNPVGVFPSSCLGTRVQLHVMRDCRGPFSTFQDLALAPATLTAASVVNFVLTSTSEVGNLLDVRVHNPSGINLCALSVRPYGFSGPFQLSVDVTEGSYVGRHAPPSACRLVVQGSVVWRQTECWRWATWMPLLKRFASKPAKSFPERTWVP